MNTRLLRLCMKVSIHHKTIAWVWSPLAMPGIWKLLLLSHISLRFQWYAVVVAREWYDIVVAREVAIAFDLHTSSSKLLASLPAVAKAFSSTWGFFFFKSPNVHQFSVAKPGFVHLEVEGLSWFSKEEFYCRYSAMQTKPLCQNVSLIYKNWWYFW